MVPWQGNTLSTTTLHLPIEQKLESIKPIEKQLRLQLLQILNKNLLNSARDISKVRLLRRPEKDTDQHV